MNNKKVDVLYDKIEELEKKRMSYLEVDDNISARRIKKQIEQLELKRDIANLNKMKQELDIYKNVVRKYPAISCEINRKLEEVKSKAGA